MAGHESGSGPTSLGLARLERAAQVGRDISKTEMAELIGTSREHYSKLERGKTMPSLRMAQRIAIFTKQTAGQVLDEYIRLLEAR